MHENRLLSIKNVTNYTDKLKSRYTNYDYSNFKDNEKIYNELYDNLLIYEKNNLGKKTVIHGDPVMTNIIINTFGKIKFIKIKVYFRIHCIWVNFWLYWFI